MFVLQNENAHGIGPWAARTVDVLQIGRRRARRVHGPKGFRFALCALGLVMDDSNVLWMRGE
jgi:hypothetical protein